MSPLVHDSSGLPNEQPSSVLGWAGLTYALVLVYASLAPFTGWQTGGQFTIFDWPKYLTTFDIVINVAAYAPLGGLLALWWTQRHAYDEIPQAFGVSLVSGFILSVCLELLQGWLPARVSSPADVLANTVGSAAGALAVLLPAGRRSIALMIKLRWRYVSAHRLADWGLLLLLAWWFAQLNPAIPIFEAGLMSAHIIDPVGAAASPYDLLVLLPQALGVALNVTALALFISVLTRDDGSKLVPVLFFLVVSLVAKLAMAALLMKAPLLIVSLSPATVIGITSGLLVFMIFAGASFRWRAFWATLFVFAGGVMSKLVSVYAAWEQARPLFNWGYGQLANFTSLTKWLNEIWPIAALIFLATVFVSTSSESS
jgi:VanZ family protein